MVRGGMSLSSEDALAIWRLRSVPRACSSAMSVLITCGSVCVRMRLHGEAKVLHDLVLVRVALARRAECRFALAEILQRGLQRE